VSDDGRPAMPTASLILGDCLDVMGGMSAGSFSHVVCDPPYGISNESYDRGPDPRVWAECYRVTGPDAALLAFSAGSTYHRIASAIEAAGWKVRQMWAWVYRDGFMTSAWPKEGFDRLAPAFDPIVFATRGKVLLSLQREGETEWVRDEPRRGGQRPGYSGRASTHGAEVGTGRWPRSVVATEAIEPFQYFVLSRTLGGFGWAREKVGHPNQKPASLMSWLVSKLPDLGRPILDPYAGSATTGVACLDDGRDFVGIEVDPAFHAIGSRRLADHRPLLRGAV
jgi:hypothetical protein